jgi:alpha-galactosidase
MAVNYVNKAKTQAVLFAYDIHPRFQEKLMPVKLQGLDPMKQYRVKEINLMPGAAPTLAADGQTFTGDYLMKVGLDVLSYNGATSHVVELTAE